VRDSKPSSAFERVAVASPHPHIPDSYYWWGGTIRMRPLGLKLSPEESRTNQLRHWVSIDDREYQGYFMMKNKSRSKRKRIQEETEKRTKYEELTERKLKLSREIGSLQRRRNNTS